MKNLLIYFMLTILIACQIKEGEISQGKTSTDSQSHGAIWSSECKSGYKEYLRFYETYFTFHAYDFDNNDCTGSISVSDSNMYPYSSSETLGEWQVHSSKL